MENGGNIPSYKMNNVTRYIKMIEYVHKVISFMLLLVRSRFGISCRIVKEHGF